MLALSCSAASLQRWAVLIAECAAEASAPELPHLMLASTRPAVTHASSGSPRSASAKKKVHPETASGAAGRSLRTCSARVPFGTNERRQRPFDLHKVNPSSRASRASMGLWGSLNGSAPCTDCNPAICAHLARTLGGSMRGIGFSRAPASCGCRIALST